MVNLYIARVHDADTPEYLSEYRKNKLQKQHRLSVYRESLCVELLLIKALAYEGRSYSLPLDIITASREKPEINGAKYHISLSHAGGYVLCAISDDPVGADIEAARNVNRKLADRYFSDDERESIDSADDFLRIWVQKESFVKASGLGLAQDLQSFSVFDEPEKYRYFKHGDLHIAAYSPTGEKIADTVTELNI